LNEAARKRGLTESQITQYGLPIRKGFWAAGSASDGKDPSSSESKDSLRKKLGIQDDLPTVLVVGGGDGMGGIVQIAKSLGSKLGRAGQPLPTSQMVVVCGNNQEARRTLEESYWEKGVKVHIQGFVDNMDEWMKASDALVTKAGPGTIAEASICGLPCMMFSFL